MRNAHIEKLKVKIVGLEKNDSKSVLGNLAEGQLLEKSSIVFLFGLFVLCIFVLKVLKRIIVTWSAKCIGTTIHFGC